MQMVTRPRAQGYGALLGSEYFRLAPDNEYPLRPFTRDSLAQRTDDRGSPEENVLEIGYAYVRTNYSGGEGLDWWPRQSHETERATDKIRFWDSENLEISRPDAGQPYRLTLVPEVGDWWTPGSTPLDMGTSRNSLYVIEGQNVHRFDDRSDTTPDDTDNIGVNLSQLAVGLDNSVAVLDANGDVWFKGSQTNTYLKVYDSTVDGDDAVAVWYVKDRIIIACNDATSAAQGTFREVAPAIGGTPASPSESATVSTVDTFEQECLSVVDAGHAIIASFSDGSIRSYVPQTDTAGGTPALTVRGRTQVPLGEVAVALVANLGVVLVFTVEELPGSNSTTLRVYKAAVLDERFDFVTGNLQLLRTWKNTVETAPDYVKRIAPTRDEILFAVGEASNTWNLWRYDMVTDGLFRHHAAEQSAMDGLVYFDGLFGWIEGSVIVFQSSTNVVADGYLITPNITFGLNTPINWTSFILEVENITGGAQIDLYYSTDEAAILDPTSLSWVKAVTVLDQSQTGMELPTINTTSNHLALMLVLRASVDFTESPRVNQLSARGLPKHRDWLLDIPISVSDMVYAPGRAPLRVPGHGDREHQKLVALQGASVTCQVFDPPITLRGVVDQIMEPTAYITSRGSQGRRCMVRFLGTLIGTEEESFVPGVEGMGIGSMGITTMGIGES